MIDPKSKHVRFMFIVAPFATFLLCLASFTVFYQSYFGYFPPPVSVVNVSGNLTVNDHNTSLVYERISNIRVSVSSKISRRLICNDHWVFEFPPSSEEPSELESGKVHAFHERVPFRIPAGTICVLNTTAIYHPPFSLRDHTYSVPDMVLTVEAQ